MVERRLKKRENMTHSTDLQWLIVRRNSKFLQLRNKIRLSSDAMNNNGNWTKRHAGFLNPKATVLKTKGDKIVASIKTGDNVNQPKAAFKKQEFAAGAKASDISKAIAAVRPDLADVTFRRARKLAGLATRTKKVLAARKERSAKITYKHKTVRPKRK
jgi:large subunit ribosomal protein L28e